MTLSVGLYWFTCYVCAWGYWINTYWYSYMIGYTGMFEKGVFNPIYWLLIPMLIVATLGPQVRSNQALSHLPPGFTCTVVHVREELAPVSSWPLPRCAMLTRRGCRISSRTPHLLYQVMMTVWQRTFYPEFRDLAMETEHHELDDAHLARWSIPLKQREMPLWKDAPRAMEISGVCNRVWTSFSHICERRQS